MAAKRKTISKGDAVHPDAWKRFEAAVDAAVKHGPVHKAANRPRPTSRKPRKTA